MKAGDRAARQPSRLAPSIRKATQSLHLAPPNALEAHPAGHPSVCTARLTSCAAGPIHLDQNQCLANLTWMRSTGTPLVSGRKNLQGGRQAGRWGGGRQAGQRVGRGGGLATAAGHQHDLVLWHWQADAAGGLRRDWRGSLTK